MTEAPSLFDRQALTRARMRSVTSDTSAWFLHDLAMELILERLKEINREFTKPAIVGFRAKEWAGSLGLDAKCIGDDETLNLAVAGHDLVVHGFGLHCSNDPVGQLVQMRRALTPDGLMIAVMLGGQTLHQLRAALAEAELAVSGGIRPRVAPMAEIRDLGGLLQRAGFALPVADTIDLDVRYSSLSSLCHDLRAMAEGNTLTARSKNFSVKKLFDKTEQVYKSHFSDDEGKLLARFDLLFLTGWSPDDSQQKPLQPGSAQSRLAESLGVPEHKVK